MKNIFVTLVLAVGLMACQGYNPMDEYDLKQPTTDHSLSTISSAYPIADVKRGKYLAELLACGTCHTDGALIGEPNPAYQLAGSRVGIAYSNPFIEKHPGILYPSNITPDVETGIGAWRDDDIIRFLRTGMDVQGKRHIPVMPWPAYKRLTDQDALAMVAFLRSLKPVTHQTPDAVSPGNKAAEPFVHFGVYQSKKL